MNNLNTLTTSELSDLIRNGDISSEELVRATLDSIQSNDSKINSFIRDNICDPHRSAILDTVVSQLSPVDFYQYDPISKFYIQLPVSYTHLTLPTICSV